MTHRQFVTWQVWLAEQWNNPSRSDYYAMATTTAVERVLAKNPGSITLTKQVLKFDAGGGGSSAASMSKERAAELSKARWAGFFARKPAANGSGKG
jgi:hypothetical protein